ncbi:Yos1-like protein [Coniophora puteana RWD-64-598 SS2]|uniref:Yos1-like protein n=1 Tax=Coniophora puteana (strain RWD-64-598) TaxID=741705 RepID=A0A5M3MB46_CONPW|nr:Yos1-like protein [Coniophora puteana RWD-64-598 SS2]EIW76104.1 Yos1-like protein [Coniophora puteana RWD-64-598 SS2]
MLTLGTIFYVSLLLINAIAVLSEDRFLARIGWSTAQPQNPNGGFQQTYDQSSYGGQQDVGVKGQLINLISAVRTLMRSTRCVYIVVVKLADNHNLSVPLIGVNLVVIVYEVLWGG